MKNITIRDKEFTPFISYDEIEIRIRELARRVNEDYADREPLFLAILNGSFMFAADLFKYLDISCAISFVKLASYKGTTSTGTVVSLIGLDESLKNRDVIVLEDIVDTGKTLSNLLPSIEEHSPASLRVMTLLNKPDARTHQVQVDYVGFDIPNKFIVGYGLDYDGLARNLRDIYQLVE